MGGLEALTAWHFYSVSTRLPEEYRLTPGDARRLVEAEILGRLAVHGLPARRRSKVFEGAVAGRVAGGRIYDLHIGSVAIASGARTFATENLRHFRFLSPRGVRVVTAAELIEEVR